MQLFDKHGKLVWETTEVGGKVYCPHGKVLLFINGTQVRNNHDSDFVQGGNGYRYKFCPKNELWVDDCTPEEEIPFVLYHECVEAELMKKGMSYDEAHDIAKRKEDRLRRGK